MVKLLSICNILMAVILTNINCEHNKDKLKEFEKLMGKPNIYCDEQNNLVLLVTIHKGSSNRVIDSGIECVGIQLENCENCNVDEEVVKYLSSILQINKRFFSVAPGEVALKKILKISGTEVKPYEVIDKLVEALEITAKEEPNALKENGPLLQNITDNKPKPELTEDPIRVFDWRNKR